MCGIAGIITPDAKRVKENLIRMLAAIRHRGPDDLGVELFPDCALGHVRLSIVDLETGKQPMLSPNHSRGIVFNGEIYGFREIKETLKEYRFKTTSDTELLLALFDQHGENCPSRIPGMFSFGIWDQERKQFFAARDRFGEKPLYYSFGKNGEFIFASEIKAILASGLVEPVLDLHALGHFLKFYYVHPHSCIYKNIFTLPPAHFLEIKNTRLSVERYWQFPEPKESISVESAIELFQVRLKQSVEKQLVADVPVGAFLSGGLDSSTIVAVAASLKPRIKTFSFGFEDSATELPFAQEIAEKYKTDHFVLTAKNVDIGNLFLKMQDIYDEPFADSSNIPTFLISSLAREHLKVILTGDGGDELFGGYTWWYHPFVFMQRKKGLSWVREKFLAMMGRLLSKLHSTRLLKWTYQLEGERYLKRFPDVYSAYADRSFCFSNCEIENLLPQSTRISYETQPRSWALSDSVNDAMRMDLENYMPGDILVKTDRASMANSLELRAPFLDVDFASFCISLPTNLKIDRYEDKIILRRAFQANWTTSIRKRGKQGFGAPFEKWMERKTMVDIRREFLENPSKKIFSIIPFKKVQSILSGKDYRSWILLVLAVWMEKHSFQIPA